nr:molybdopterin molybdotransferase MoeA [Candidatus Sigynarchaeota archaeon]
MESRFLKTLKVDDFSRLLETINIAPSGTEHVSIDDAAGRVLSRDVTSAIDVPSFAKSTVDGYALKASATFGANEGRPLSCSIAGTVEMGMSAPASISSDYECIYVPTGGFVPAGADAVVKIEFTKPAPASKDKEKAIQVYQAVVPGDGIVAAGADIKKGSIILKNGDLLTPARLGMIAAAGFTSVDVFPRLKVGLFSSGNEITAPGRPLTPGKIYDVNTVMLKAMIERLGCIVNSYGILPDDMAALEATFSTIMAENSVVICSGGTSKGKGDLMPALVERNPGTSLRVHGVRIKPGKPIIFAMISGKPLFVLPGNPVSAFMTLNRLVAPALRRWNKLPQQQLVVIKARLSERVYSEFGRLELKPVLLEKATDESAIAKPVSKGSETITTLVDASGYFEIPENVEIVEKDTVVDVILFSDAM